MQKKVFSYHHPSLYVQDYGTKGRGLTAGKRVDAGEILVITAGYIVETKELATLQKPLHPFQIERNHLLAPWSEDQLDGIFLVNHSCEPNAGVRGQVTLVALKNIGEGEEITYDYVMTDSDPNGIETYRMECQCGKASCRKIISDFDWLKPDLQKRYAEFFSTYLKERILKRTTRNF